MVGLTVPRMSALTVGTNVLVRRQQQQRRHVGLLWLLLLLLGLLDGPPPFGRVDAAEATATAVSDMLTLDDSRLLLSSSSSLPLRNNQEEPNNDSMEASLPIPETKTVVEAIANDDDAPEKAHQVLTSAIPSRSSDVVVDPLVEEGSKVSLTCRNDDDDDDVTSATTTTKTTCATINTIPITAPSTTTTTTIPAWAWFLVQCLQHVEHAWSLVLVPLYTMVVIVYLGMITFRHSWHVRLGLPLPHFIKVHCTTTTTSTGSIRVPSKPPSDPTQQSLTATDAATNDSTAIDSNNTPFASEALQSQPQLLTTTEQQPINLTGSYQLVSSHNVDAFLAAQGVPWALRKLATSAVPIHHLHHAGSQLIIKIEAPSTGFATQSVYTIGGDAVETQVRGRLFRDAIRYLYNDDDIVNGSSSGSTGSTSTTRVVVGIVTEKHAVLEGYVVTVARRLSADGSRIDLTSVVSFPQSQPPKPSVVSSQVFERIK